MVWRFEEEVVFSPSYRSSSLRLLRIKEAETFPDFKGTKSLKRFRFRINQKSYD